MKALFMITETEYGIQYELLEYLRVNHTLKSARQVLMKQINIIASRDDANETQPTMNYKDRFHFFIDKETRHMVISNFYKSDKCSIRMRLEAIDKINDFSKRV